jgi:uncharacterized protein YecE (DUF72 family)
VTPSGPRLPRIGCAGWSLPAAHRAAFARRASVLETYAQVFDAVEINSSFYRPHQARTYLRWAESVPAHFRFSVKMPREITHDAALRGVARPLDRFLGEAGALGTRLGGLLIQLPPGLVHVRRVAANFFALLRRRHEGAVALEPRHPSWFDPEVDALLREHRIARVAADPPRTLLDGAPGGHAGWRYFRWHGTPRIYYSRYGDTALRALCALAMRAPARCWCIFDNTAAGHAIGDALRLRAMCEELAAARPTGTVREARD